MKLLIIFLSLILLFGCVEKNKEKLYNCYRIFVDGVCTYVQGTYFTLESNKDWGKYSYELSVLNNGEAVFKARSSNYITIEKVKCF
jgi:hypothetical protein